MYRFRKNISLSAFIVSLCVLGLVSFAFGQQLTNNDDRYTGSSIADDVDALKGDDHMEGRDGGDALRGSEGKDDVWGEDGWDNLYGGIGQDDIRAGTGQNLMNGSDGTDQISGVQSNSLNTIDGGADDDIIDARNGSVDTEVKGGGGQDTCYVDNQLERGQAQNNSCESTPF